MSRDGRNLNRRRLSPARPARQAGLSLVELMIGLVIGLVLLGGVLQTLLASKEASVTRQNMTAVTEDARFLFEFMSRDLRMIGRGYASAASIPLSYASKVLTAGYKVPTASGTEQTVQFTYTFSGGNISYNRVVDGTTTVSGTLVDGLQNWELAFGVASGAAISYTGFDSTPADMNQVVAIRSRVTFADSGSGDGVVNVASKPIVTTVALRNRIADLLY